MTHTIPAGDPAPQKQRSRKTAAAARTRPASKQTTVRRQPSAWQTAGAADRPRALAVRIRAGSPEALLAIVPHLLGFPPESSMVIIGTEAQQGAVKVTLRYDLPDPPDHDVAADLAEHAAAVLAAQRLTAATVIGYGPEELIRPLATAVGDGMSRAGIEMAECLRVEGGRYWSYTCGDDACCPAEGRPFDETGHPAASAIAAAGERVLPGRSAVAAGLAPLGGIAAESMRQATSQAERHVTQVLAKVRKSTRLGAARHMIASEGLATVAGLIAAYRAGGRYRTDYEVAWLTVALKDLRIRDDAWARMDPRDRGAHLRLWTDVVRRAQPGYVAAPASLLAFVAWQDGNGALANVALDRALKDAPGYSMATLLRQVIAAGAPPAMARLPLTPAEVAACYDDLDGEDPDDQGE
ncbi:MAG TPA: DUF4192 domain-containing protein [Streptosporangiaceae bacterium]